MIIIRLSTERTFRCAFHRFRVIEVSNVTLKNNSADDDADGGVSAYKLPLRRIERNYRSGRSAGAISFSARITRTTNPLITIACTRYINQCIACPIRCDPRASCCVFGFLVVRHQSPWIPESTFSFTPL